MAGWLAGWLGVRRTFTDVDVPSIIRRIGKSMRRKEARSSFQPSFSISFPVSQSVSTGSTLDDRARVSADRPTDRPTGDPPPKERKRQSPRSTCSMLLPSCREDRLIMVFAEQSRNIRKFSYAHKLPKVLPPSLLLAIKLLRQGGNNV